MLLSERTLNDGSQTVISLLYLNADTCIIRAANARGETSTIVDPADAHYAFHHPFSRPEWLDYPGTEAAKAKQALRELTPAQYAALEDVQVFQP